MSAIQCALSILVLLLVNPAPLSALYKCRDFKGEEMTSAVPCERLGYLDVEKDRVFMDRLSNRDRKGRVIKVVDGATLKVKVDGIHEKVRLIGIDAPKRRDRGKKAGRKRGHFGLEAAQYAERHLQNKTVRLEFDRSNAHVEHRDKHGRLLAYVYLGRELFNLKILRDGYARARTKHPFSMKEEFRQAEREARRAERGLWWSVKAPSGKREKDSHRVIKGSDAFTPQSSDALRCYDYRRYYVVERAKEEGVGSDILVKYKDRTESEYECRYVHDDSDYEIRNVWAEYFFGMRGRLLFLDSGTGPEPRGLEIHDLNKRRRVYAHPYSSPVEIDAHELSFWSVLREANEDNCREYRQIVSDSLFPFIEERVLLDVRDMKVSDTGELRCVGQQ